MVIVNVVLFVPPEFIALIVTFVVPVAVAVPLRRPVAGFRASQDGKPVAA
jgi:hypothetical protein